MLGFLTEDIFGGIMTTILRYDNGLKAVVSEMNGVRSLSVGFWVGVGSSFESADINGLSHFTEHMMFKGTDTMSPFDIADKFESFGANINAFTGKEYTCYYFKSVDEYGESCFDLLSQIFYKSTFDETELDKERKVILEEINMVEDDPEDICYDLIANAVYGNCGYGQTILGPSENVLRYKKADVDAFVQRFYTPDNTVIAFAGNITPERADELIKKYVLPLSGKRKLNEKVPSSVQAMNSYKERIKDFEQTNITLSFPSMGLFCKERAVLACLNAIFGSGMSSRLFQSIREQKGLAYSVYSTMPKHKEIGTFNICLNISVQNTAKVLEAVKLEIDKLLIDGVTDKELARAKVQLKSATVFGDESVQTMMLSSGKQALINDDAYDAGEIMKMIDDVTLDNVNEMAKKVFVYDKMNAAYVGKKTNVDILGVFTGGKKNGQA